MGGRKKSLMIRARKKQLGFFIGLMLQVSKVSLSRALKSVAKEWVLRMEVSMMILNYELL
jgi:hypothetical protein